MPTHQLLHTSITIEASYANSRTFDVYYRIDMLDAFRFTVGFYFFMENLVSSVRLLTEIGALTKSEKRNYESIRVFVPSFKRTPLHGHFCPALERTDSYRPHRRTLSVRTNNHEQSVLTNTSSPYWRTLAVRSGEQDYGELNPKKFAEPPSTDGCRGAPKTWYHESSKSSRRIGDSPPGIRVLTLYEFQRSSPGQS